MSYMGLNLNLDLKVYIKLNAEAHSELDGNPRLQSGFTSDPASDL